MAEDALPEGSQVVERTETTRTQRESEEIRNRLSSIQEEIGEIESQVRKDAESLERLRSMLDVSYLEEITSLITDLEARIQDVAREADQATKRANQAEEELLEEQERLEKLWDVYKTQEEELQSAQEAKEDAEAQLEQQRSQVAELEDELEAERRALRQAQEENGELREEIADLQAQTERLTQYEDLEARVDELTEELEDERERLTKLYAVFEETEAERDDLAASVRQWEAWFDAHRDAFEGTAKAFNEAPATE